MRYRILLTLGELRHCHIAIISVREKQRIVSEAVFPTLDKTDMPLHKALCDRFDAILVNEYQHACKARRTFIKRHGIKLLQQLGIVSTIVPVDTAITRRIHSRSPIKSINDKPRIIRQHRSAR